MADPYPNIDEFGRGACTCSGTMTGCAVCSTADVLLRYGKAIPRLSDGTPDMRTLGARMGKRHRDAAAAGTAGDRHGLSLLGHCTGGTNWCAYCAYLELRAAGLAARYQQLSWASIEAQLAANHPVVLPGLYGRIPYVSPSSYTGTVPARGRSDATFGGAHMVVAWRVNERYSTGAIRNFAVSDSDFGSPARPVVPPHSVIARAALKSYWSAFGWAVCYVATPPPSLVRIEPWWGSDVDEPIQAAYTARSVALKLRSLGITNYGKAINDSDLEAGLEKRGINYGTSVQLVDVRALMKP